MHYGVKGMKWGVRKSEPSMDTRKGRRAILDNKKTESLTVQTKNGVSVTMTERNSPAFSKFLSSLTKSGTEFGMNSHDFDFHVDGKKVGTGSFEKKSKDEIYLNWVGVDPPHRGQGYGSAVFDAGIAYGREQGASKFTLEVPGNSPDARHIYEKRGFAVTKEATAEESDDSVWGGLTEMELDLRTAKHMDAEELEFEAALEQTFPPMPQEVYDQMENESSLTHYGTKGMKWGVRKAASDAVDKAKARSSEKQANRASPNSSDHERASAANRKAADGGAKKLSNEELRDVVTRMNLEQQYRNLSANTPSAKAKERARKAIIDGVIDVGLDTAVSMVPGGPLVKTGISAAANVVRSAYGSGPMKKEKKKKKKG